MLDKKGQLSMFRVGLVAAGIGALFIIGAILFFFSDRAAHQVPLEIAAYPNAVNLGSQAHSDVARTVVYKAEGVTADQVVAYYQGKMDEFYGASAEPEFSQCKRFPKVGNQPEYDAGKSGVAPYQYTCLFDRSGFYATQTTAVMIQPGLGEFAGAVMIAYEQTWQQ